MKELSEIIFFPKSSSSCSTPCASCMCVVQNSTKYINSLLSPENISHNKKKTTPKCHRMHKTFKEVISLSCKNEKYL